MSYVVKRGDSPASIARRHGVSVNALFAANPHKSIGAVGVGGGGHVMTWTSLADGEPLNIPASTGVGSWGLGAVSPAPLNAPHKTVSITNPGPHVVDADVALLQTIVGVTPDGLFGPNTQAAVKSFQSAHGLAADGIAGPKTWAVATATAAPVAAAASLPQIIQQATSAIPAIFQPSAAPTPIPASVPTFIPTPVVTPAAPAAAAALATIDPCYSDNVSMVCAAQRALGVAVDGKYGNDTATALRKFIPGAPAGCTPRPSWWTPTGQTNCGGGLPATPVPMPALPSLPPPVFVPSTSPGLPQIPSVLPAPSIPSVLPSPSIPSVLPVPTLPVPATTQSGPVQPTVTAPAKAGMSTGMLVAGGLGAAALVAVVAMAASSKKGGGGSHAPASRRSGGHRAARKHTSRKRR